MAYHLKTLWSEILSHFKVQDIKVTIYYHLTFFKESGKSWWLLIIFVIYIINLRIFFCFHRIKLAFNLYSTKIVLYKISLIRILCQGLINEPMILLTYQSYSSKSDQLRDPTIGEQAWNKCRENNSLLLQVDSMEI